LARGKAVLALQHGQQGRVARRWSRPTGATQFLFGNITTHTRQGQRQLVRLIVARWPDICHAAVIVALVSGVVVVKVVAASFAGLDALATKTRTKATIGDTGLRLVVGQQRGSSV
jgi:hypothetical protein